MATGFQQQTPIEGASASEVTEVRVLYDAANLYIGAFLRDSDPSAILSFQKEPDADLSTDDGFMWVLDTFGRGRGGYYFETNPAGMMGDGLVQVSSGGGALNKAWDGIWDVRVAVGPEGWTAEIRIPFATLNFDPNVDEWGINFQRTVRRKNEDAVWSGYRRNQGLLRTQHAGRLVGLRGIDQGLGLETQVYGKFEAAQAGESAWGAGPLESGVDLNYSVTPNLRASITVNTDFAETEVDERQVNLTRFPLFVPEQRDFFLEGSSVFEFARPIQIFPYFSRRIGLVGARSVPIRLGGRLTGEVAGYDLGVLQIRTGPEAGNSGEDFTIGRIVRRFWRQSSVGGIYTRRAAYGGEGGTPPVWDRQTVGIDYDLFTSRFLGDRNLQLHGFAIWNTAPDPDFASSDYDRSAFGSRLAYTGSALTSYISVRRSGRAFNPAVGFVPRNDFRHFETLNRFTLLRPNNGRVRSLGFFFRTILLTDDSALDPQSINVFVTPLDIEFESGARLTFQGTGNYERLEEPFSIASEVEIPADLYRFQEWTVSTSLPQHWKVSGGLTLGRGGFWDGSRVFHGGSLTVRSARGASVTTGWESSEVRLPWGHFSTLVVNLRGSWHLSPRLSVLAIGQFDDVSDELGSFFRLRWIVQPGSELYLVYGHDWADRFGSLQTSQRRLATKMTYTYRF
ncbi:MAG: carbohydrate binding family 9 domain-containing protein [Dehalococcoidia bacterium]